MKRNFYSFYLFSLSVLLLLTSVSCAAPQTADPFAFTRAESLTGTLELTGTESAVFGVTLKLTAEETADGVTGEPIRTAVRTATLTSPETLAGLSLTFRYPEKGVNETERFTPTEKTAFINGSGLPLPVNAARELAALLGAFSLTAEEAVSYGAIENEDGAPITEIRCRTDAAAYVIELNGNGELHSIQSAFFRLSVISY